MARRSSAVPSLAHMVVEQAIDQKVLMPRAAIKHRLFVGFPGLLDSGVARVDVMLEAFPFAKPVSDVEGRGIRGGCGSH